MPKFGLHHGLFAVQTSPQGVWQADRALQALPRTEVGTSAGRRSVPGMKPETSDSAAGCADAEEIGDVLRTCLRSPRRQDLSQEASCTSSRVRVPPFAQVAPTLQASIASCSRNDAQPLTAREG